MKDGVPKLSRIDIYIHKHGQDGNFAEDISRLGYLMWEIWYQRSLTMRDFSESESEETLTTCLLLRKRPVFPMYGPMPVLEDLIIKCWEKTEGVVMTAFHIADIVNSIADWSSRRMKII